MLFEVFQEQQPRALTFRFFESSFVLGFRETDWSLAQAHVWCLLYVLTKCFYVLRLCSLKWISSTYLEMKLKITVRKTWFVTVIVGVFPDCRRDFLI